MPAHHDISKKRIIDDLRTKNKTKEFVHYTLFEIDHRKFVKTFTHNKCGTNLEDNIDSVASTFYKKKVTFHNFNYKLNAHEDLLLLIDFWIDENNCDRYN